LIGVVGSSKQIFAQITGSLLKDGNTPWKKVKDAVIILVYIFLFGWFITGNMPLKISFILSINILLKSEGCVWVFRMPLPNMTRFPDSVTSVLPGLMKDVLMSLSTSKLPIDQLASVNSTVVSLISPEKHCAFPVYGLAVKLVVFPLVEAVGCFVMITVTAIVLFFLPSSPEVENASNEEKLQISNV